MRSERWQRIEQIYHAAMETASDRRAVLLAELCGDDDALRREVEEFLAANEQSGGFLSTPAFEVEAKHIAAENAGAKLAIQVNQELSHYKILSPGFRRDGSGFSRARHHT